MSWYIKPRINSEAQLGELIISKNSWVNLSIGLGHGSIDHAPFHGVRMGTAEKGTWVYPPIGPPPAAGGVGVSGTSYCPKWSISGSCSWVRAAEDQQTDWCCSCGDADAVLVYIFQYKHNSAHHVSERYTWKLTVEKVCESSCKKHEQYSHCCKVKENHNSSRIIHQNLEWAANHPQRIITTNHQHTLRQNYWLS